MAISSWLRSRKPRTPIRRQRPKARLRLEGLEDRTVPSWVAVGSEFQANTTTEGDQGAGNNRYGAAVAMDAEGDYVVAWRGQGSGGEGLYAQRYDSDGTPLGSEFQLNSPGTFLASWGYQPVIAG